MGDSAEPARLPAECPRPGWRAGRRWCTRSSPAAASRRWWSGTGPPGPRCRCAGARGSEGTGAPPRWAPGTPGSRWLRPRWAAAAAIPAAGEWPWWGQAACSRAPRRKLAAPGVLQSEGAQRSLEVEYRCHCHTYCWWGKGSPRQWKARPGCQAGWGVVC